VDQHDARVLRAALALTGSFFIVELVGGWLTNSLALLSDAVHMFTDVGASRSDGFRSGWADRPPSESKTYGYQSGRDSWRVHQRIGHCACGRVDRSEAYAVSRRRRRCAAPR